MMNAADNALLAELEELRRQVRYMRRNSEALITRILRMDIQSMAIRRELEQKRRGFSLMANLAMAAGTTEEANVFVSVSRRINAALNMQRTAVLLPESNGEFKPAILQGYSQEEEETISSRTIKVDKELLAPSQPVLVTETDSLSRLVRLRVALGLPYFIATPVFLRGKIVAILITGRLVEELPFLPPLGQSDVETVQTVSIYLGAMLAGRGLDEAQSVADIDPLTQLPNLRNAKNTIRHLLALAGQENKAAAVLVIELDGFERLKKQYSQGIADSIFCIIAGRLLHCVRESDVVSRIEENRFLVGLANIAQKKAAVLVADKILGKISERIDVLDHSCQVNATIGIAVFPEHGSDPTSLVEAANIAMCAARKSGVNLYGCQMSDRETPSS